MMNNSPLKKLTAVLLFLLHSPAVWADNKIEFTKLLEQFSRVKQSTVDFKEEKYAFYLDEPLKTTGYLTFTYPDKLAKYILTPEKISHEVSGNKLTITNSSDTHHVNLDEHPEFNIILQSIISLLSGNYEDLNKNFIITFNNKQTDWTLLLKPRKSFIAGQVEQIQMNGSNNYLSKIIVTEPNKDRSITHIFHHR